MTADTKNEKQQLRPFKRELPPNLRVFVAELRQHPLFHELLHYMQPTAPVPHYAPEENENVEKARATWIFRSGQWSHYKMLHRLFTGENPKGF